AGLAACRRSRWAAVTSSQEARPDLTASAVATADHCQIGVDSRASSIGLGVEHRRRSLQPPGVGGFVGGSKFQASQLLVDGCDDLQADRQARWPKSGGD